MGSTVMCLADKCAAAFCFYHPDPTLFAFRAAQARKGFLTFDEKQGRMMPKQGPDARTYEQCMMVDYKSGPVPSTMTTSNAMQIGLRHPSI